MQADIFKRRFAKSLSSQAGVTLIELIASIVVLGVVLTMLSTVYLSMPGRSAEPVMQIRAAELAQALMDEILSKRFDENAPIGGVPTCLDSSNCTLRANFGADTGELSRVDYDDVDDYNESYCAAPVAVENSLGVAPTGFENFTMQICVEYDGDYDGVADTNVNAKLITVDIFPPPSTNTSIRFVAYRGNF